MEFSDSPEFTRDLKRLIKRYRSLPDDLQTLRTVLASTEARILLEGGKKHATRIYYGKQVSIYKLRLACRSLKSSEMRLIYAAFAHEKRIEFIQLYFKGDEVSEDRNRLKAFIKAHT